MASFPTETYCGSQNERYPVPMDIFSQKKRSEVMARVRSKDTGPELAVRRFMHARGLRFRLHRRDLPGCPDLVFPSRRVVVFVHGCFWHRHPGCKRSTMPTTNASFWQAKFEATVARDAASLAALNMAGWNVLVVWECQVGVEVLVQLYESIAAIPIRN